MGASEQELIKGLGGSVAEPAERDVAYSEGYKAGWATGWTAGAGCGYNEAKVRMRLSIEAAVDVMDLSHSQRDVLYRAVDNITGKVQ